MFALCCARSKGSRRRWNSSGMRSSVNGAPDFECVRSILQEDRLPVSQAHRDDLPIVIDVYELLARRLLRFAAEVVGHVVAVDVVLEVAPIQLHSDIQLVLDVRAAARSGES